MHNWKGQRASDDQKQGQGEQEIELLQGLLLRGIQILACVARWLIIVYVKLLKWGSYRRNLTCPTCYVTMLSSWRKNLLNHWSSISRKIERELINKSWNIQRELLWCSVSSVHTVRPLWQMIRDSANELRERTIKDTSKHSNWLTFSELYKLGMCNKLPPVLSYTKKNN
jgi:hypothetical protein